MSVQRRSPAQAEPADDDCGSYAEDRQRQRSAAPSGDRTQLGVVPVGQLHGPQLGGPSAETAEPAADGGGTRAGRRCHATVTEASRPGREGGADDLDEIVVGFNTVSERPPVGLLRPCGPAHGCYGHPLALKATRTTSISVSPSSTAVTHRRAGTLNMPSLNA